MPADTPASAPGPGPGAAPGPEPDENPADPAAPTPEAPTPEAPTPEVPDAGPGADGEAAADASTGAGTGAGTSTGTGTGTGMRADDDSGATEATGDAVTAEAAGVTESSGESGATVTNGVTEGPPVAKIRNRRFSLTRDTARPEGGGRAAPGDAPAPARQWPMLTVLGMVGAGLLLTGLDVFRVGTVLIGLGLLTGGLLRWALPSVGMLAVRSRFTDMITYGVLGGMIVLLALMTQPDPVLVVPFLEDTLHFTIQ